METRNWILEQLNYNTSDDKSLPFLILATMGYRKKMKSKKPLLTIIKPSIGSIITCGICQPFLNRSFITVDIHPDIERVLVTTEQIQARVIELAQQIDHDYAGVDRLYIVGILKGAFIFLADLTRQLRTPHVVDFMALSSYGRTTTSGAVRILMDLREPVEGQHVLVVEDIVDTGHTLDYLLHILNNRKPASLRTCVLVRKQRQNNGIKVDYLGFEIPDVWVVGYGLDYADRFRTLPYVAELKRHVYTK
jgi:hypoxanthine phosphoribosyltransferase